MGLQVLDAAPGQVGRGGADPAGEIAPVDQGYPDSAPRQGSGGHRAVDTAADDQHVEQLLAQFLYIALAQACRHFTSSCSRYATAGG